MSEVKILNEDTAVEAYSEFRAELDNLKEGNDKIAFDYKTQEVEVRKYIYPFRKIKGSIEKKRKELKADSLAYGRMIDSTAKSITSEVQAMIDLHEQPLLAIKEAEEKRIANLNFLIDSLKEYEFAECETSEEARGLYKSLDGIDITEEVYEEKCDEAVGIKARLLSKIADRGKQLVQEEKAEADRLAKEEADRAEAQRLREEQIAADAKAQAENDAAEALAKAEQDKIDAEAAAEAAKVKAEEDAKQAEIDKQEAIKAEAKRIEDERIAKEQSEAEAEAKRVADKEYRKYVIDTAANQIIGHTGLQPVDVYNILDLIEKGHVDKVSIKF